MGDAMHYTSGNLKEVGNQVDGSIEAVVAAYKNFESIATRTGMGADSGDKLNQIFRDTNNVVAELQKKVERMGDGVVTKQAEDKTSARKVDDIWYTRN